MSTDVEKRSHPAPPILVLRDAHIVREKGGQRFALHIPSLVMQPGEFTALVGPSGCGKSTLLDILGLILKPTRAACFQLQPHPDLPAYHIMTLSDEALARLRRSQMGYVLQIGGLLPYLTVQDNILLPCRLNGMTKNTAALLPLVQRLGIADQLTKKPQYLSSGQRQRVAIARALIHHPTLVLADEPTAAVDQLTAHDIRDIFKELTHTMGLTVCLVTHDESLIAAVADRTFAFEVYQRGQQATSAVCRERK